MNEIRKTTDRTVFLLNEVSRYLEGLNLSSKSKRLKEMGDRLKKGHTVAVVCGEFKRGKSSFINALIEEPKLCPVDIDITTSLVTQIKHSKKENARVYFTKQSRKKTIEIELAEIQEFVTEQRNKGNQKEVELVDVSIKNDFLDKYSLVLVDTPGVGSLNEKHSEVTYAYLAFADVLLFVSDVTAPLTTSELDFIKRAKKFCSNIFFILSKTDISPDWEVIEQENRKKLKEIFKEREIRIFPVSSSNKLDYLESKDEDSLEDSNFTELEQELGRELRGSIIRNMLSVPLEEGQNEVTTMMNKLTIEYNSCCGENKQKIEDIKNELLKSQEKLKGFQKTNAKWRTILNDIKSDINYEVSVVMKDEYNILQKNLMEMLKNKEFRNNEEEINNFVKNAVIDITKETNDVINNSMGEIQNKLVLEGGLDIDIPLFSLESINTKIINQGNWKDNRTGFKKAKEFGRAIGIGGMVVGGLATVATLASGGTLFPAVASLIGASTLNTAYVAAGAAIGYVDYKDNLTNKEQANAIKFCKQYLQELQREMTQNLRKQLEGSFRYVRDHVEEKIKENIDLTKKTINEINYNLKLEASEAEKQSKNLKMKIEKIKNLSEEINKTITEVQSI
ncbi:dynamin family protein [Crassaminicella profunda]|uniref:dynamin family protein n=1 Tax=Crassaminicella profunda TaxID=1286698 RepID=UPI001CA62BA9|nr:dynamin family protein [Crassaminicella profunda]QZY56857.1 dynamin family protein [Crassaminicella profunda]